MNDPRMRPALYRSVWLWLGVFVQVFLVWAWADSLETQTWVRRVWGLGIREAGGDEKFEGFYIDYVTLGSGRISGTWCRPTIRGGMRWGRYLPAGVERGVAMDGTEWAGWPTVDRHQDDFPEGGKVVEYRVDVPMWSVMGLCAMGWGGVLVWRRRRWKRSAAELSEVE